MLRHLGLGLVITFALGGLASQLEAVEEVYVYHLLVRSRAAADKALDEIVNEGISRENFIRVARKYSMDHPTKATGGDLGWNSRRKLVKPFADVAFDLEPGRISDEPVRTEYGWHLIYVKEKRDLVANRSAKKTATTPQQPSAKPAADASASTPPARPAATPAKQTSGSSTKAAPSAPPATAKPEVSKKSAPKPTPPPVVIKPSGPELVRPRKVSLPGRRIVFHMEVLNRQISNSGAFAMTLNYENQGTEYRKVFHPSLLPLGISMRSEIPEKSYEADFRSLEEPESWVVDLAGADFRGVSFRLNDFFKRLPVDSRYFVTWDADTFLDNFRARFSGKRGEIESFEDAKNSMPTERSKINLFRRMVEGLEEHNRRRFAGRFEIPVSVYETLSASKTYYACMKVDGETDAVWFELFLTRQSAGVNHFARLAQNGFYDYLVFFDSREGEYIRAGCPRNDGTGIPQRTVPLINSQNLSHEKGVLSLATRLRPRDKSREAGSIFFICQGDLPDADSIHVPIGKVVHGQDLLDKIESATRKLRILSMTIVPGERAPDFVRNKDDSAVASTESAADSSSTASASGTKAAYAETRTVDSAPASSAAAGEAKIVKRPELPRVRIQTSKGDLTVELYQDDAPNTVANFIDLVDSGFYSAAGKAAPLSILRHQPPYYVQTGSPDNSDAGGPGYTIASEIERNTRTHELGTLSMSLDVDSSSGKPIPDTAGSQFMICLSDVSYWNGLYAPFGRVISGIEVLKNLGTDDTIQSIDVLQKRSGLYKPKKR